MRLFRNRQVEECGSARWWRSIYFHHIGKTAGTSLVSSLADVVGSQQVFPYKFLGNESLSCSMESYRLVAGHFPYVFSDFLPQPCARVTFVREPRAHILSLFNYCVVVGLNHVFLKHRERPLETFADFLNDSAIISRVENFQTFSLGWQPVLSELLAEASILRGVSWKGGRDAREDAALLHVLYGPPRCDRSDETLLCTAKQRLEREFCFVGIVEEMASALDRLSLILGAGVSEKRLNVTRPTTRPAVKWSDLSEAEKHAVDELTELDRELYSYAVTTFRC